MRVTECGSMRPNVVHGECGWLCSSLYVEGGFEWFIVTIVMVYVVTDSGSLW